MLKIRNIKSVLHREIAFRPKYFFQDNISKITDSFPEAKQVRQLGIENYKDKDIWQFAKDNNYTIVTYDADFYELSNLKGHPPKIIWLRLENTSTDFLAALFISKTLIIKDFIEKAEYKEIACLEIK